MDVLCFKNLLLGLNFEVDKEDIFKQRVGNESLRKTDNDIRLYHNQKSHCEKYNVPTSSRSQTYLDISWLKDSQLNWWYFAR
jgi:hypothetical protein